MWLWPPFFWFVTQSFLPQRIEGGMRDEPKERIRRRLMWLCMTTYKRLKLITKSVQRIVPAHGDNILLDFNSCHLYAWQCTFNSHCSKNIQVHLCLQQESRKPYPSFSFLPNSDHVMIHLGEFVTLN